MALGRYSRYCQLQKNPEFLREYFEKFLFINLLKIIVDFFSFFSQPSKGLFLKAS